MATMMSATAQLVVRIAPSRIRMAAASVNMLRNASRFAHVTTAAAPAPAAESQASRRTLSHAGRSGRLASRSRANSSRNSAAVAYGA